MNPETLYQFMAVAQEGNISAAARKLMIAQPALSKRMQALERELGCTLFIRGSRKVILTEAGEALRERAGQMKLLETSIRSQMREYSSEGSNQLRLGMTAHNVTNYLSPIAAILIGKHPNLHFNIFEASTQEVINMVRTGIAEAGIIKTRFSGGPDIEVHCCIKDPLAAVWHKDYPFQHETEKISIKDINGVPLSINRGFFDLLNGYCAQEGFIPNVVNFTTSIRASLMLVNLKKTVGIAPISAMAQYPFLKWAPFYEWYMDSPATLVTLKGRLPVPVRDLIEIFKGYANESNEDNF